MADRHLGTQHVAISNGGKFKKVLTQLDVMAEREALRPTCLVLIFGLPASGKTTLTRTILECVAEGQREEGEHSEGTWVALHFDHFYPPDLRSKRVGLLISDNIG